MSKPFYASKTIWFNGLTILIALATHFGFVPNQQLFNLVTFGLVGVSPLINLLLRFATHRPITSIADPSLPLA